MTPDQVRALLRQQCSEAGSQAAWAKQNGISAPYLSDVLAGRRDPGPSILALIGLEKAIVYRPKQVAA